MTSIRLEITGSYERMPLLATLAAHAVPGLEVTDRQTLSHTRVIATSAGPTLVTVRFRDDHLLLELDRPPAPELLPRVRRWFDLDTDPSSVSAALGADPVIGPLVLARPGLRILGSIDGFETALLTVLGQQVSLAAARTFGARLVRRYGVEAVAGYHSFPVAATVAAAPVAELQRVIGLPASRARTIHAVAAACADGLAIDPSGDHAEIRRRLLELPGIGPWTVDYLAFRALGDRDAFPADDLVLKRALGVGSAAQGQAMAEAWRPLRAYAVQHLWSVAAYA
ncbi:DNA-3-methyladenine glycosylase [Salinibacterium sp. ZJ450]|uniref:DNA-3-methyladenine glycosylase family protein n=1 Tax=Salinibacterium sp. ZJ450 TaxID=2708338 RepID=UPI00141F4C71|nr:DNA-3-methyladenine glycosylase 2 family protein [Salinibacterium sp. ZJ450]